MKSGTGVLSMAVPKCPCSCRIGFPMRRTLALRADLRMACQLIGRLGVTAAPVVESVKVLLEQLDGCDEPAAKQYSLACKALTHWPEFSDVLEQALLDSDREAVYSFAHDMRELSVRSFRPDLLARFLAWPTERQEDFVGSLGTLPDNADFLFQVATSNALKDVRAKAIATLAWEYGGTSAATDAWLAAPDEVKDSHEGMQAILYRLGDSDVRPAVLENILRLAAASSSRNLLLDAARELPLAQCGFAVEAAKAALLEQHGHPWQSSRTS
ncbi:hypothetical protein [Scleromatobacter humisilvae]|uniref:Uncharacterized protein n=1 Tax=Scleromatobacter humisilvae TaxID=2897159 RepID=A0A9X1YNJ1_9BURK|nr:hypothetical protein [Scleromatobacter humisilvae]MCK9689468.1 hypothetical protein [Scleromatobacter humisilvae]